jgi:hypothetical protein
MLPVSDDPIQITLVIHQDKRYRVVEWYYRSGAPVFSRGPKNAERCPPRLQLVAAMSTTVATKPYADQKPGTSGLRKKACRAARAARPIAQIACWAAGGRNGSARTWGWALTAGCSGHCLPAAQLSGELRAVDLRLAAAE